MRRNSFIPAVIAILILGGFLTAKTSSSPAPTVTPTPSANPLSAFYTQTPTWVDCGDGFECTTIQVPLDYTNPSAKSIAVALNRLPATDASNRLGSLVVNPGGPGGSGLDYARGGQQVVSSSVLKRFDLVGFDPRGVGQSTAIRCLSDREEDQVLALDQSPNDKYEEQALIVASQLLANRCKEAAGDALGFMSSTDVARDMDIIRAVLGDRKLNYLGKSYGTYLGAIYADLFPKRVGRFVLDGAIDPTVTESQVDLAQAMGFEGAIDAFIRGCIKSRGCPLGKTAKEVRARITGLVEQLDRYPLKTDSNRKLTQSLGILGIVSALYDQEYGWPVLEEALQQAFNGDGTLLMMLSDQYVDRDERGKYLSNSNDIAYVVSCLDRASDISIEQARIDAYRFQKSSPIFGPFLAWSMLPCDYWPATARPYPAPITAKGAGPIVVIGTLRDPATPYQWAQGLARQLTSGRLLTWNGDGHTAYSRGSSCIDRAVDSFFLSGTVPPVGKVCR